MVKNRSKKASSVPKDASKPVENEFLSPEVINLSSIIGINEIVGQDSAVEELKVFINSVKFPGIYSTWGQSPAKGILLHGSPGTGKTALVKAVVRELAAESVLLEMRYIDIANKFIDAPIENIRKYFEFAENASKDKHVILFIDEIDSMIPARNTIMHDTTLRRVNVFLEWLDGGFNKLNNITLIGATNFIELVDEALLRPGRIDKKIELNSLDADSFIQGLKIYLDRRNFSGRQVGSIKWKTIKNKFEGKWFTGAEMPEIINRIVDKKINRQLMKIKSSFDFNSMSSADLRKVSNYSEYLPDPICTKDFITEIEIFLNENHSEETNKKPFGFVMET